MKSAEGEWSDHNRNDLGLWNPLKKSCSARPTLSLKKWLGSQIILPARLGMAFFESDLKEINQKNEGGDASKMLRLARKELKEREKVTKERRMRKLENNVRGQPRKLK